MTPCKRFTPQRPRSRARPTSVRPVLARCDHFLFLTLEAKHDTNIARIIVARMPLRSLFKLLRDRVRFNQVRAA